MKKLLTLALLSISVSAYAADVPQKPDPVLTPGVVNPAATKAVVCVPNYTGGVDAQGKKVRDVSESVKKQVFAEYKIDPKSDKFEVDHLISLELGGANDIKNLWPQSYTSSPYNAHLKDALENKLHKMICSGQIDMATAQKEISTDWIAAYNKYVKN